MDGLLVHLFGSCVRRYPTSTTMFLHIALLALACFPSQLAGRQEPYHIPALASDSPDISVPHGMKLHALSVSGSRDDCWNLAFFADGYTDDQDFVRDASRLTEDMVSKRGALGHVKDLLNVYGVYVPSKLDGIGNHSKPLDGAAFGLYRPGDELRAVMLKHRARARAACRYWRDGFGPGGDGGCDQPIILGNDPSYGGLGGEFTIITASKLNGPLVLRHELGHSLIPVGEEYEGGFAYFGVNSQPTESLHNLSWSSYLTSEPRIEDMKVPLQVYPWHNLTAASYAVSFQSANERQQYPKAYPTALLRLSVSSVPKSTHLKITMNSIPLSFQLPDNWEGSYDRVWLEIAIPKGLAPGESTLSVELSDEGKAHPEGPGGRLLGSLEVIEYGGDERFNATAGVIGAFPTFAFDGGVTLRPTNEGCLMRKVNHPTFCPVCADGLEKSLIGKIAGKKQGVRSVSTFRQETSPP